MTDTQNTGQTLSSFQEETNKEHERVNPCFMTGQSCLYGGAINESLAKRRNPDPNRRHGFMIMPFRPNIRLFLQRSLRPFLEDQNPKNFSIDSAEEMGRPGVIMCEGICKRIQEADFIVADISIPNPNVLYELGLAYGLNHKMLLVGHGAEPWYEKRLSELDFRFHVYNDLQPLSWNDSELCQLLCRGSEAPTAYPDSKPAILFYDDDSSTQEFEANDDVHLNFSDHVKSAVRSAIKRVCEDQKLDPTGEDKSPESPRRAIDAYSGIIWPLASINTIAAQKPLKDIKKKIDQCYCLILNTGAKHVDPLAHFWLGYCHAIGKNVVPISIVKTRNDRPDDLAFDIRAQRHVTFFRDAPELLQSELYERLSHMIVSDFSHWSRKRFWNMVTGDHGISIFTGALRIDKIARDMVGDWDLRAAAELISYFRRLHYPAKIEAPLVCPDDTLLNGEGEETKNRRRHYFGELKKQVSGKNCILIGSAFVNPLTEIVLGEIYHVEDDCLFSSRADFTQNENAIIAFKDIKFEDANNYRRHRIKNDKAHFDVRRAFYYVNFKKKGYKGVTYRGFESFRIVGNEKKLSTPYTSKPGNIEDFKLLAHLGIFRNPFGGPKHFIIILNGLSGPATFALTHAITGGVGATVGSDAGEYNVKDHEGFNPEAASERLLNTVMESIEEYKKQSNRGFDIFECLIRVNIASNAEDTREQPPLRNPRWVKDWRIERRDDGTDVLSAFRNAENRTT